MSYPYIVLYDDRTFALDLVPVINPFQESKASLRYRLVVMIYIDDERYAVCQRTPLPDSNTMTACLGAEIDSTLDLCLHDIAVPVNRHKGKTAQWAAGSDL